MLDMLAAFHAVRHAVLLIVYESVRRAAAAVYVALVLDSAAVMRYA